MVSIEQISNQLTEALKSRNAIVADTLRGLKTRIQNEKIAKGSELSEPELIGLVSSEVKRRKEAAEAFRSGGRIELADKELAELAVLQKFLPPQLSEEEIGQKIDELSAVHGWSSAQFGQAMGVLKSEFGNSADGAVVAKILKQKLGN